MKSRLPSGALWSSFAAFQDIGDTMLRAQLSEGLKSAMKARQDRATSTIRLILAALKDRDIAARGKGNNDGISDDEIRRYVASGDPLDKAGAYGIQGKASMFIESIHGSYTGVVGLPMFETAQLLGHFGFQLP